MIWDLQELEHFLALARTRSFSQAARECAITQPAFSRRIQQLEARVGFRLVNRAARPVRLTAEGEQFLKSARRVFQQVAQLERSVASLKGTSRQVVRIAAAVSLQIRIFAPRLNRFYDRYPHVSLELLSIFRRRSADLVHQGEAELVFTLRDPSQHGVWSEVFFRSPLQVIVPPRHRLAGRPLIEPANLEGEPFVGTKAGFAPIVGQQFEKWGIAVNPTLELDSIETSVSLVAAAQGISILPRYVVTPAVQKGEVVQVPLAGGLPDAIVYVGAGDEPEPESLHRTIIEFFRPDDPA
ncbi:MAG: LysR family transcriptional regulator [Candidatus Lambdaproteobacteria bacterium]|nr:LysR family transcriptional regulator [Candidatus Lambdaproteobacteria bacterium]